MIEPRTEDELAQAVREAVGPLRIVGGGTRCLGRSAGTVLSTAGLSGVSLYEPGALTIVAGAGTPLAEVEAALAAENQRLPFEPMSYQKILGTTGVSTIGGVVAANASGPRRIQVGACRDSLIGVRFVDGRGDVIKNGGRVMKNVTGYDLVKLMAGSWGTLGVISEVAFKVLPAVESCACVILKGLEDGAAVAALSVGLGSCYEVSGAAHVPMGPAGNAMTVLRLEGFEQSMVYRSEKLRSLLSRFGDVDVEMDPEKVTLIWRSVRDVEMFSDSSQDVWRISVKPSDGPKVAQLLGAGLRLYDWGGGLIWIEVPPGFDVRSAMQGISGHATLMRGVGHGHVFHPEPAPLAALSAGLRAKFDPRGILNAGMMG